MEISDHSSAFDVEVERRREPRNRERKQITVWSESRPDHEYQAWLFNASESGVCFRCRDALSGSVLIELDPELIVEAQIVWGKEVVDGVWEYGASLRPLDEDRKDRSDPITEADLLELTGKTDDGIRDEPEAATTELSATAVVSEKVSLPERRPSRFLLNLGLFGLLACALFLAWNRLSDSEAEITSAAPPKPGPPPAIVETVAPRQREVIENATSTGQILPRVALTHRASTAGIVESMPCNVGDRVRAGRPIVTFEDVGWIEALETADAATHVADARWKVARSELTAAQQRLKKYRAALRLGAVNQSEVDEAASRANLLASRERLARERLVAAQTKQTAQLRALKRSVVSSRIAGVIAERFVTPGDVVQPGEALVRIVDIARVRLKVAVDESAYGRIRIGQTVNVRVEALRGESFNGKVAGIAPELDPTTRSGLVWIEIDNVDGRIKPGMTASAVMGAGKKRSALFLPRSILRTDNGQSYVLVVTDKSPRGERRDVELGRVDGEFVEIRSGVSAAERIVVTK